MSSRAVVSTPQVLAAQEGSKDRDDEATAASECTSLDFIAPSDAVKSLFSVPYNTDGAISVAVHNMDGTLLLDAVGDVTPKPKRGRRRPRPASFDNSIQTLKLQESSEQTLAMVTSILEDTSFLTSVSPDDQEELEQDTTKVSGRANAAVQLIPGENLSDLSQRLPDPENYTNVPLPAIPREYINWKFHDLQLLVSSEALIYRDPHAVTVRVEDADKMRHVLDIHEENVRRGDFVADYKLAMLQRQGKPTYAQQAAGDVQDNTSIAGLPFAAPDYDRVHLQTCSVPSSTTPLGGLLSERSQKTPQALADGNPVCAVLDAYLDNIMANVPQLALCLREKGLIQSVKLLETEDIPSSLMLRSTLETSDTFSISKIDTVADGKPLFSPQIMDMNATSLLRFLKSNCTRNNSTYLLQREAGHSDIQLYDISSISAQRQRKWIWWLAMMSYRFALRLRHLSINEAESSARQRAFRSRQRSLLQNALNLLDDLTDMGGSANETLCAAVRENLAETFLVGTGNVFDDQRNDPVDIDRPVTTSSPPYANVSVDALNKAQDHLQLGIKKLLPFFESTRKKMERSKDFQNDSSIKVSDGNSSSSDDDSVTGEALSLELQSISLQLFSLHHKLINVSLRLAEHHLSNYYSSSAMQALRTSARTIAGAISILRHRESSQETHLRLSLRYQFTWLWEHCGHFARSFAADELWRERGHACGDDIISVLRDVENIVTVDTDLFNPGDWFNFVLSDAPITDDTGGLVSLHEISSIVEKEFATTISEVQKATKVLDQQKTIQREKRRVLVSACVSYSRAIGIFEEIIRIEDADKSTKDTSFAQDSSSSNEFLSLLRQRLGDSCNEIGKILLQELRHLISSKKDIPTAEIMLHSAQFWFDEGLTAFESCRDLRNLALLRCNLCQCWKIRANTGFISSNEEPSASHAENCLQTAADHLQKAHEALGEREVDPVTWDMVSQELAATFLVLGVRRRQSALGGGSSPVFAQALRLSPGQERGIVEPMEQALHIYQDSGNEHQAAAANYQLALFYSKVWTCQRDEMKTREKLSAAFANYAAAHSYFGRAPSGNESTFVILCLDLSNLYAAVSGEEFLSKALSRCLDTTDCFSKASVEAARGRKDPNEWFVKMETLASSVEERIFKLLVSLVKLEKESNADSTQYKDIYRTALTSKMTVQKQRKSEDVTSRLAASYELLASVTTACTKCFES